MVIFRATSFFGGTKGGHKSNMWYYSQANTPFLAFLQK